MKKTNKNKAHAIIIFTTILFSIHSQAQVLQMKKNRVVIVADASYSMNEFMDGYTKVSLMTELINDLIAKAKEYPEIEIALRTFGNNPLNEQECSDSELEVPFFVGNESRITNTAGKISPYGQSPVCYSLSSTIKDFPQEENQEKFVLLIIDGTETCNGNLCETYKTINNTNITIFAIGMDVENTIATEFHCFPHFRNAHSKEEALNAMKDFIALIKPY